VVLAALFVKSRPKRMMKSVLLSVAFMAVIACAVPVTFTSCGANGDPFSATSLDVDPFPITHGANTSIVITGTAGKQINGGQFHIKVYLGILPVFSDSQDFCKVVTCPIQQGPQTVHYYYPIPSYAPGGVSVTVEVQGVDETQAELFCYKFDTKVVLAEA
jgi:hypothetical protein